MSEQLKPQVRLYAILAREANVAVVFRRGPSKRVQLLLWRTDTDEFHEGQWFKGRIYERRSDLSPSGKLLVYFAADHKQGYFSWTAVSKPPFLTALALWPKGDCWGGGGLFANENELHLNHRVGERPLAEGFHLPAKFQIKPLGQHSGGGEDDPIMHMRLTRDGWKLIQDGEAIQRGSKHSIWIKFNPPIVYAKPDTRGKYELQMYLHGIHQREGPWYIFEHVVKDTNNGSTVSLGRAEWADWCHSGDLLFANYGRLFRLGFTDEGVLNELSNARLVIDLSDRRFSEMVAPVEAKQWD
jgi:hypothetical protein